jgi:hypothetical protein
MHPDVSLVGCFKEEFGAQTQLWEIPFHHKQPGRQVILETVKNYNYLGEPTCVMFRREDVEKVGGFRNYSWITDWEMWVRLLTVGNGYIIPERLCFTRNHPGQLTKAIYRMHVHYLEEYHFFKSIKAGDYKIDINHSEAIINKAIKRKAAGYAQIIPKAISKVYQKNYRQSLYRAFAITLKEGVWFQTCSLWYNKLHWKVFKA